MSDSVITDFPFISATTIIVSDDVFPYNAQKDISVPGLTARLLICYPPLPFLLLHHDNQLIKASYNDVPGSNLS